LGDDALLQTRVKMMLNDAIIAAMTTAREALRRSEGWDNHVYAYWFGYNGQSGVLRCEQSTSPSNDFLRQFSAKWGRDIIGTACRRREGLSFSRTAYKRNLWPAWPVADDFLSRIGVLLALPVMPLMNWVVGVLVVASSDEDHLLRVIAEDKKLNEIWGDQVEEMWKRHILREGSSK
jgi:hypothetical protein